MEQNKLFYTVSCFVVLFLFVNNSSADTDTRAAYASDDLMTFAAGRSLFKKLWVAAPATTKASDGLGPLYNARSCFQCHINAGRGQVPDKNQRSVSLFMRLSIPPQNKRDKATIEQHQQTVIAEPSYGIQLQTFAITGLDSEAELKIEYNQVLVELSGGESVWLQQPSYRLDKLRFGQLHPDTLMSPRMAPPLLGLGKLAVISERAILQYSDPNDRNQDGISGKPNRVWSREFKRVMLGRFGYKAGVATLDEQNQSAFVGDLGLSTPLFPNAWGDCTKTQTVCRNAPQGDDATQQHLEAPQKVTDAVLYYVRHLVVPRVRQSPNKKTLEGQKHFIQAGCTACHRPSYRINQQTISPYSDLLLHDMGEGLADHRPEGAANGKEWRTAPLWGIGLTEKTNGHHYYLHDGRARTVQQAILWHGGEAKQARDRYIQLNQQQRQQLLNFLGSL